jgi:hypothetical protein
MIVVVTNLMYQKFGFNPIIPNQTSTNQTSTNQNNTNQNNTDQNNTNQLNPPNGQ